MLPSPLLRARMRGGRLLILFARGRKVELNVAKGLISLFESSVGKSLSDLSSRVEDLEKIYEAAGVDYKLYRGLSVLLLRRCGLQRISSKVEPVKARLTVYSVVNNLFGGFLPSDKLRGDVLRRAAGILGVGESELEESMYSDSEDAIIVREFRGINAPELLKTYNLALLQTALFKAASLTVETSAPGWEIKPLLRDVKYRGLMYTAYRIDKSVRIVLDGPSSLIKMTTRYGTAMAKVVPSIVSLSNWCIRASVVKKVSGRPKYLTLFVDDSMRKLFPERRFRVESFDSAVERDFYRIAQQAGWKVEREPEPLVSGKDIVIPDFKVSINGIELYVEIVGFWTAEYLKRKIEKLRRLRSRIIVFADKRLACSSLQKLPMEVVYYDGKITPVQVYKALSKYRESRTEEVDVETVKRVLKGEIVDLKMAARRSHIDLRILEEEAEKMDEYLVIGGTAIHKSLSSRVSAVVKEGGFITYGEAYRALLDMGIPEEYHVPVLEAAGFSLKWRGIDIKNALIIRKRVSDGFKDGAMGKA